MSLAVVDQVGDALAAEINAKAADGTIVAPQDFTAVRAPVELSDWNAVTDLQVIVVPDEVMENTLETRGKLRGFWYRYSVYVYARVADLTNDSVDDLKAFTEQIADWFGKSNALATYPAATPKDHPNGPLVGPLADPDILVGHQVFASLIELPVYVLRQM